MRVVARLTAKQILREQSREVRTFAAMLRTSKFGYFAGSRRRTIWSFRPGLRRSTCMPLFLRGHSRKDRGARPEVTGEGRVKVRPASAVRASGLASLPAEKARAPGAPEVTFEKCPEGVTLCCVLLGSGHRARPVSR